MFKICRLSGVGVAWVGGAGVGVPTNLPLFSSTNKNTSNQRKNERMLYNDKQRWRHHVFITLSLIVDKIPKITIT